MVAEQRCLGLLLKLEESGESDLRIWAFSDAFGRLLLRAPGARKSQKRFIGLLHTFSLHTMRIRRPRQGLPVLLGLEGHALRHALRENLAAFAACSYAAELAQRLTELDDPNPPLFHLLRAFFDFCESRPLTPKALCRFHLRLLEVLGLQPRWDRCMECGQPFSKGATMLFDLAAGGLRCTPCGISTATSPIDETTRTILAAIQRHQRPPTDTPIQWSAITHLLDLRIAHLLGEPPRSRAFLREMVDF